ncbi:RNA polymerase II-binding domain-containing protein [Lophiotrema nucula]|uniref:RNA polymerase II-binding domain-containing protein n=1 Tax=Lophiotrema nucula TaxID=690887 RepID=A0A6A5Z3N6_9PLEO|nr:RNA polymerase II-binding domain-containing protein [Lophiotrema nucula]
MAFTDDAVRAKLSSLNETQDSIVTVSQWIMFHRRHADRTAQLWLQRIKESTPSKKLTLIYLANEIVQQSKIRKKDEFVRAYDPIIVDATTAAYKGSSSDVQNKIRRVVEVWRQRQVFRPQIQDQIEREIDALDKTRSSRKPALGGSLFSSSSVPLELSSVAPLATALQKSDAHAKPSTASANEDYAKLTNPSTPIPSPPMHAAALSALVKKLATAEGAVAESIKARQALIAGLEKLLETNKTKLSKEQNDLADISTRKSAIESRTKEVEDAIIRGLSSAETAAISSAPLPMVPKSAAPERPDIEELTPPPMESFTPVGSPKGDMPDDVFQPAISTPIQPIAVPAPPNASAISPAATAIGQVNVHPAADLLSSLTTSRQDDAGVGNGIVHGYGGQIGDRTLKKRKMSRSVGEDEYAAFAGDGDMDNIDADLGSLI